MKIRTALLAMLILASTSAFAINHGCTPESSPRTNNRQTKIARPVPVTVDSRLDQMESAPLEATEQATPATVSIVLDRATIEAIAQAMNTAKGNRELATVTMATDDAHAALIALLLAMQPPK